MGGRGRTSEGRVKIEVVEEVVVVVLVRIARPSVLLQLAGSNAPSSSTCVRSEEDLGRPRTHSSQTKNLHALFFLRRQRQNFLPRLPFLLVAVVSLMARGLSSHQQWMAG